MATNGVVDPRSVDRTFELRSVPVVAVRAPTGYTLFKKNGVNLVAVQSKGMRWYVIRAEQESLTLDSPSEVVDVVIECLGHSCLDTETRLEVGRVLWKDWD